MRKYLSILVCRLAVMYLQQMAASILITSKPDDIEATRDICQILNKAAHVLEITIAHMK